ncbi:unnamed protein product [Phaeothamnion confervicola]
MNFLTTLRDTLTKDYKLLLHIEMCASELLALPQYQRCLRLANALSGSAKLDPSTSSNLKASLMAEQFEPSDASGGATAAAATAAAATAASLRASIMQQAGANRKSTRQLWASTTAAMSSVSSGDNDGELDLNGGGTAGAGGDGIDARAESEWALFETRKDRLRASLLWAREVSLSLCHKRKHHDLDFELEMHSAESGGEYTFSADGQIQRQCAIAQAVAKRSLRAHMESRHSKLTSVASEHDYGGGGGGDTNGKDAHVTDSVRMRSSRRSLELSARHEQTRVLGWLLGRGSDGHGNGGSGVDAGSGDVGGPAGTYNLSPARLLSFPRSYGRILVVFVALWAHERWEAEFDMADDLTEEYKAAAKVKLEDELRRRLANGSESFVEVLNEVTLRDYSEKYAEPLCALILEGRLDEVSFLWHFPGEEVPSDPLRLVLAMKDLLVHKEFFVSCDEHGWNSYTAVFVDPK